MLARSAGFAGALSMGVPSFGEAPIGDPSELVSKLKVVVVGAHPDDPESGCGGSIARYSDLGHEVVIVYLTAGEAGIDGKVASEAAAIRTAESRKACAILKARPVFAGQIDGDTEVNPAQYKRMSQILDAEQPALLFTQWPIDSHRDHRAASLLVYDYWLKSGRKADLFYYEVETGAQTQNFKPTHYLDITQTEDRKRTACLAHASQNPETTFYPTHDRMQKFRGMEYGCHAAEGFVCQDQSFSTRVQATLIVRDAGAAWFR
jgi:LmbE family N-acetylglucosaminyl deacetylase